jgi:hypothetical protein
MTITNVRVAAIAAATRTEIHIGGAAQAVELVVSVDFDWLNDSD